MIRRLLVVLMVLGVILGASMAIAQTTSGTTIDQLELSGFPEVLMLVTAPSEYQTTDLAPTDWIITENGEPVEVTDAIRVGGEELQIVLVIDVSGSMAGDALTQASDAARGFVANVPADAELAVVSFGDSTTVAIDFTTDHDAVRDALDALEAGGETALYDGIVQATLLFDDSETKKSVVILTDGADTASVAPETQAVSSLVASGANVYAIEYETSETASEPLTALADAAGGSLVKAGIDDLSVIYDEIAARITSQYVLRYTSDVSGIVVLGASVRQEGSVEPATLSARFPVVGTVDRPELTTTTTVAPTTTVPATLAGTQPDVPLVGGRSFIWYGLTAVFVASFLLLIFLLQPGKERERKRTVRPSFRTSRQRIVGSAARGLVSVADRAAAARPGWGLQARLAKAGLNLRPGEYIVFTLVVGTFLFILGWVSNGIAIGLVLGLAGLAGGVIVLNFLGSRRQRAFENQLPEILDMLASTIRTGYAPLQATELVSRDVQDPARTELGRVVAEARLGRDYIDAMAATAVRTHSEDLRWVVGAMEINRDVGGDISEVLETVSRTIRERVSLRRMIAALSAEGRLSAWILIALPFFLMFFINATNPGYLEPLVSTPIGIGMLIAASISMVIGIIVIRRIVNLEP